MVKIIKRWCNISMGYIAGGSEDSLGFISISSTSDDPKAMYLVNY